jgi:hypothetical protein
MYQFPFQRVTASSENPMPAFNADFRYRRFSDPKSRAVDQQFIDLFDLSLVWDETMSESGGGVENLPEWGMLSVPRMAGMKRVGAATRLGQRRDRGSMAGM